ncbi:MAG: S8 family serine peptidase, partial [Methanosarcinales archaeon]|nr:S8 family serine peptidase [Methanosarcinales archaeon]
MTKMIIKTIAIIMLICISLSGSVSAIQDGTQDDKIPVIIVFKDNPTKGLAQVQSTHISSIQQSGGEIEHRFHVINAVSARMSPQAIDALSKNKDVLSIEQDIEIHTLSQSVSWGVNRVEAPSVHPFNKGTGIKVAIIDSGIDYTHPDLNDNYKGGYDFVNNDNDPMDDHGHGTKVAGVIAAEDNTFGVLGVAPEASLYGLKVLRSDGVGYSSNIIRAIEWAVDNHMDIVSMSIGSNAGSYAYQQAVNNAYNSGVLLVASAGNSGSTATDNVMYPAKYDSVVAISAMSQANGITSFSSVGPAVELTAP